MALSPFQKLRKRTGLTQRALSARINRSTTTIANWETGDTVPPLTDAAELAPGYGVTREQFERTIIGASRAKQPVTAGK